MASTSKSNHPTAARSVSAVLLDFVFGEPLPQPEPMERGDAAPGPGARKTMADGKGVAEFEDTRPTPKA